MGLVNRVLPDTELDDYVLKIALELAANAPLTIAAFSERRGCFKDRRSGFCQPLPPLH